MKITVITVSYNSAATIRETIDSVLGQDYPDIEYIIVDGKSTDRTQEIVSSYGNRIAKFVSEKDAGLYDAMNKGISMATGEVIGILNSDDLYADSTVVSRVVNAFQTQPIDVLYGDLYYFKTGAPEKSVRRYEGGKFSLRRVSYGLMPPHPTFFVKKTAYDRFGKFNTRFTLSADFDLILRLLGVHRVPFLYIPEVLAKMRVGGKSTSSLKRIIIMNNEDLASCRVHGVKTNVFKFYLKYLVKIPKLLNP